MLVNLEPMPYRRALELLKWAVEHDVDAEKCQQLLGYLTSIEERESGLVWTIDVPDRYMTWFTMKWAL